MLSLHTSGCLCTFNLGEGIYPVPGTVGCLWNTKSRMQSRNPTNEFTTEHKILFLINACITVLGFGAKATTSELR
jgi:hypothetical protein